MAAKRVLGAMGGWFAAAGLACGQAGPFNGGLPPSGPAMLPEGGGALLDAPPGAYGMPDMQGPGERLPPVPQAWMNSAFNPAPVVLLRTEAMFLRSNQGASEPLARQADIVNGGVFGLVPRGVQPESRMFLTPRISMERLWPVAQRSLELSGWASVGPNATEALGRGDFPLFLGPVTVGTTTPGLITNAPASFPTVADVGTVRIRQTVGNVELMYWKHASPMKGAVADIAWGFGGRYLWLNERLTARFEDQVAGSATPFGELGVRSQNDMFGPQFGAKSILQFFPRRFRVVSEARIGLLNNDVRHSESVTTSVGADATGGRQSSSHLSVAFDGSATAEFFISQYVTFFAGYQVLYVDRVQRASAQFTGDLTRFVGDKQNEGSLFYYGPKLGFVMVW